MREEKRREEKSNIRNRREEQYEDIRERKSSIIA